MSGRFRVPPFFLTQSVSWSVQASENKEVERREKKNAVSERTQLARPLLCVVQFPWNGRASEMMPEYVEKRKRKVRKEAAADKDVRAFWAGACH